MNKTAKQVADDLVKYRELVSQLSQKEYIQSNRFARVTQIRWDASLEDICNPECDKIVTNIVCDEQLSDCSDKVINRYREIKNQLERWSKDEDSFPMSLCSDIMEATRGTDS